MLYGATTIFIFGPGATIAERKLTLQHWSGRVTIRALKLDCVDA
jgi:hypothetical protein